MLHHLTGGGWGFVIRRILEAAFGTLPLLALLFLPLLFGLHHLYPWADAARVAADPILRDKHGMFALPFFLLRNLLYFVVWIALARILRAWSLEQDGPATRPLRSGFSAGAGRDWYSMCSRCPWRPLTGSCRWNRAGSPPSSAC